jgi:hypothetical protein
VKTSNFTYLIHCSYEIPAEIYPSAMSGQIAVTAVGPSGYGKNDAALPYNDKLCLDR